MYIEEKLYALAQIGPVSPHQYIRCPRSKRSYNKHAVFSISIIINNIDIVPDIDLIRQENYTPCLLLLTHFNVLSTNILRSS